MIPKLLLLLLAAFFCSCYSYTTFITPTILAEKETIVGVGFSPRQEGEEKMIPEFYLRKSFSTKMDAGLKFKSLPFIGGTMSVDLKKSVHQNGWFAISADLGLSYSSLSGNAILQYQTVGIYPLLLFGNDRLYTGMKYNYLLFSGSVEIFDIELASKGNIGFPSVVLGATIGKRFRIQPEINIFFHRDLKPQFIYSIGLLDIKKI